MLCTGWDLFVHRNFQQGGGGGVTGFPILYRKRKFIEILPEISDFYNFYEVFTHFKDCFASKKLAILFYAPSIYHLDG